MRHGDTLIRRARLYELSSAIGFLGRRRRVYEHLIELSGVRPGDRVLDVGCGTGYLTRLAAHAASPGGHAVGLDPSHPVIEYATGRAPANCTFTTGNAQDLPYDDACFDVVVSSLAIHHLSAEDRPTAMREIRRVLQPGGRLFIADFSGQPGHLRLAGALFGHAKSHSSPVDLAGLIAAAGFEVKGTGEHRPSLRFVRAVRPKE